MLVGDAAREDGAHVRGREDEARQGVVDKDGDGAAVGDQLSVGRKSGLAEMVLVCVGREERAWLLESGTNILDCAGVSDAIHRHVHQVLALFVLDDCYSRALSGVHVGCRVVGRLGADVGMVIGWKSKIWADGTDG